MKTLISCYSKFLVVVLVFLFTFSFVAVNPGPAAAGDLELLVPGELSVATEGTYPPFSMVDEKGELYGLEIGVMKEICKRIGLKYKPVIMKWDSLLIALFANQYDVISAGMDITPERQKKVTFSDGWLESGGRLVVRENSDIHDLKNLKGKVVGALVASTMAEAAEGLGAKEVKYFKSETDAMQDLINGNIDGVVQDAIAVAYAMKKSGKPLRFVPGYLNRSQKGFAFKMGKPNLVKAVNKALAEMTADGTYAKITNELIGYDPHPENPIRSIFK
jgi:polar amino acid transport system substrate-binding protein